MESERRIQLGSAVLKWAGSGAWAVGTVRPRVLKGKASEMFRPAPMYLSDLNRAAVAWWFLASGHDADPAVVNAVARVVTVDALRNLPTIIRGSPLLQCDLAELSGVSVRQIRRITNTNADPRASTVRDLLESIL